ncbi:MAG: nucleotidyltransferase domain-containing protein [Deltaproteobacteria bacterium]
MVERAILRKVEAFVKELKRQKIKVAKVIIYGSRVSGKARKYSDIDVAVVSPDFGKSNWSAKLFEIAGEIDTRIEPVAISLESYKNDTWIPLIYEIRTKGVELKAA